MEHCLSWTSVPLRRVQNPICHHAVLSVSINCLFLILGVFPFPCDSGNMEIILWPWRNIKNKSLFSKSPVLYCETITTPLWKSKHPINTLFHLGLRVKTFKCTALASTSGPTSSFQPLPLDTGAVDIVSLFGLKSWVFLLLWLSVS